MLASVVGASAHGPCTTGCFGVESGWPSRQPGRAECVPQEAGPATAALAEAGCAHLTCGAGTQPGKFVQAPLEEPTGVAYANEEPALPEAMPPGIWGHAWATRKGQTRQKRRCWSILQFLGAARRSTMRLESSETMKLGSAGAGGEAGAARLSARPGIVAATSKRLVDLAMSEKCRLTRLLCNHRIG